MKKIVKEHRVLDDTDLNNIDNKFELFKSELQHTREELKYSRNSMEKSIDEKHKTLVFLISAIGIVLAALKIFF